MNNAEFLQKRMNGSIASSLFGINIHTSANPALTERPKQTLSTKVQVSDQFRSDFDAWLLDFFGTEQVAYMIGNSHMVLNKQILDDMIDKLGVPKSDPFMDMLNPFHNYKVIL